MRPKILRPILRNFETKNIETKTETKSFGIETEALKIKVSILRSLETKCHTLFHTNSKLTSRTCCSIITMSLQPKHSEFLDADLCISDALCTSCRGYLVWELKGHQ